MRFLYRKLANEMESARVAMESERKIQQLQTEAISALWRKVSALQGNPAQTDNSALQPSCGDNNTDVVKRLAATCTVLQGQVSRCGLRGFICLEALPFAITF